MGHLGLGTDTLLVGAVHHTIASSVYKKLPYDLQKDFAPITTVALVPNVLVVSAANPAKTVAELVAQAKAQPGKLTYGSNGNVGERRRTTSSCQVAGFDKIAGNVTFRKDAASRMRYKVMHKFHDYKERFGDFHMCVGCGRCTDRCPEFISSNRSFVRSFNGMVLHL